MTWARVTVRSSAGSVQTGEGEELLDIDFVGAAGFRIGDVGEPFELGRNVGEVAELGRRERAPFNRNQVLRHLRSHARPCFEAPCLAHS